MLFISLEGLDGSGKTTIGKMIKLYLEQQGYKVLFTREPGGSIISEKIRDIILDKKNTKIDPWTEALLYIASRRQHLIETILPALKKRKIIICDRFMDSTTAYQGVGRGLSLIELDDIQNKLLGFYKPDLTLLFNIDTKTVFERLKKRKKDELNRLDLETQTFYNKVNKAYNFLQKNNSKRIIKIDASEKIPQVYNNAIEIIMQRLENVPRGK